MNTRLLQKIFKNRIAARMPLRSILLIAIILLFLAGMLSRSLQTIVHASGTITGTVYRDYNADGTMDTTGAAPTFAVDTGVQGVVVTAYDASGTQRGTATTGATGTYSLAATGTGPYRLEFTSLPAGYYAVPAASSNATTVRFVADGNSSNNNLGILKPADYSQDNPLIATPCYINGNNTGADDVLVALNYDRSGAVQHISLSSQIGSTWGLAWRPRTKTLFAAALLKRQSGLGPGKDGTRGTADDISSIYVIDYNSPGANGTGTVVTAQTIDMNSFSGVNVGANPRVGSTPANDLAGSTTPSHDYNVLDKVARRGIGGIAVSDDGNTLYVVNLNSAQPQLVSLNITNLSGVTLNSVTTINNPGCPGTDTWAPWAVRVKDGEVYVGTVCTADVSQNAQNLRAYVQKLSGSSFTNVDLDSTIAADYIQLYYDRTCKYYNTGGAGRCDRAEWTPWDNNFTYFTIGTQNQVTGVQPVLSDIEFDPDGALVLGLMDRRAHQHGTGNYSPTATDTALYEEISAGSVLKLCNVGGVFVPEGKSGCSRTITPPYDAATDPAPGAAGIPNTFFNNYSASSGADGHAEIFFGGLANLPGAKEVVATVMNPEPGYYAGGWRWYNTANGSSLANFTLYRGSSGTSNVLGKANGLGDAVLLTNPAPLEIGNRLWNDANGNGIQDANESGIASAAVQLWADTNNDGVVDIQVGTATTDAGGNYYFGGSGNTNMLSSCGSATLTPRISASADDAEEAAGTVTINSNTLELAYNGTNQNLMGLRFNGLTIPKGARITNATVQFTASNNDTGNTVNVTIQGEAVGNSTTFTATANNISGRTRTGSSVNWSAIGSWSSGATTNATSPNIAAVIQEIVNNAGWASGNSLNLIIADNASTASARRRGRSYDNSTTSAPLLSVTYDCPYTLNINTKYEIRVATGQAALTATPALTTANADATTNGDSRDSDATIAGSNAVIAITTGGAGANDHTLDMGFLPTASAVYSLGNRVFFDTNNNGVMDATEVGVGNVTVQLLDSGNSVLQTQTTTTTSGAAGYYRFDSLVAGTYKVRIAASNFTGTGALVGYQNSTNATPNTDKSDNGVDPASNNPSTAGVLSASLVVGNGALPISEPDVTASGAGAHAAIGDGRDNLTVDFGFYSVVLGNLVFIDANSNGTFDGIDTGLPGAAVKLYQSNGTSEVAVGPDGILGTADDTTGSTNQVTTSASGLYQFSGLTPGSYVVKVTPGTGYKSTADVVNTSNPNSDTDNDDNGVGTGTGQISSVANASAIALSPGSEPTVDNATGKTTNNTLDFGVNSVTDVKLINCQVTGYDKGTWLEWQTGYEVDNLGFNIYKEDNGKRTLVNPQMIGGSALTVGANTLISSGFSYDWWDESAGKTAAYWLEAVDLSGTSQWFGPYYSRQVGGAPPVRRNAALLSRLGVTQQQITRPVEAMAALPKSSAKLADKQPYLRVAGLAVKIGVQQEAWYRIPVADLQRAGLPADSNLQFLQLYVDGQELPINVTADKEGSAVEFYGICVNSPYTLMRTYYLVPGSRPGLRVNPVKGEGSPGQATGFAYSVERKDRTIYFSSLKNGETENFFGSVIFRNPLNQTLTLAQIDRSAVAEATLDVSIQGVTMVPHSILVQLNGASLGYVNFANQALGTAQFRVPHTMLIEGDNQVTLTPVGGAADVDLVDSLRLTYQHSYKVENNALKFTAAGRQQLNLDGFTTNAIRVLDITDPAAISEMTLDVQPSGRASYVATFASPESGERTFLAFTSDKKKTAPIVKADDLTAWKQTGNAADFVILTTKELAPALDSLKSLRQSQGLSVALVYVEDIYDEFSFGQKNPKAIKDFLNFTGKWNKAPRYVMFAGDASYDPKNYLGAGDFDLVPSKLVDTNYMETVSDDWLADFDGDGIADLAIGRLPVRTADQAKTVVAKITSYETATPSQEILLVADNPDIYDFEGATDALRTLVGSRAQVGQIKRGRLDPEVARRQLLEGFARGQKIVNYAGHGSVNLWRGNLLTAADASNLTNQNLPFVVIMSCLNGYYQDPYLDSLAEGLIRAEHGGAVGVWASSSLTEPHEQALMNQELYRQLFSATSSLSSRPTISEAIRKAKSVIFDMDIRRSWVFFGDPTTKLK